MPTVAACCCFNGSLSKGSKAPAYYTFVHGLVNVAIGIWLLVVIHWADANLEEHEKWVWVPPGLLVLLYIELVCNLTMMGLSLALAIGVNRGYQGYRLIYSWVWGVSAFRIYETLLGIYIISFIGSHRAPDLIFVCKEVIIIFFYWVITTIATCYAVICVHSYWRQLSRDLHGKQKKIKFHKMRANIRSHAIAKNLSMPGSKFGSVWSMNRSQSNLHSQAPSEAPSRHISTSSYRDPQYGPPRGPPAQGYGPPRQGPPPQGYRGPPPQGQYGPPPGQYGPPQGQYGPPQGQYRPPPQGQYGVSHQPLPQKR